MRCLAGFLIGAAACSPGAAKLQPPIDATTTGPDGATHDAGRIGDATADATPADALVDAAHVPPGLSLVSARDHVEGAFLTPRAIAADATRIYLASRMQDGKLFVLARDRAADFPLLQTVLVPDVGLGLTSVAVDDTHVRVTTQSGYAVVYAKGDA